MADWILLKTQYEILGKTVEELANSHNVKPDILTAAIESQGWERPSIASGVVVDEEVNEALTNKSGAMQVHHQASLIPQYIDIEQRFLTRLSYMVGDFKEAKDAKLIAETLAILKPAIMKQADASADKGAGGGGMKIAIVNQFPVQQPGDDNYVAPNAVVLGDHARQNNGINNMNGIDCIEIEMPDIVN